MYIDDVAIDITSISRGGKHNRIQSLHTDRLGSTVGVFNTSGYLHESRSYDAFGTPRGSLNSDRFNAILGSTVSPRGFTQHEHLDGAQLIHMNGRVYDYHLGRFLSVDPFIQGVGNSQGVNPYSYILNNPLAGTDPSGYVAVTGLDRWSGMPDPMGYGDNCPFCVAKDKDKEGQDNGADAGGQASLNITITADNASVGSGNVSGIGGQAQVGTSQEVIKHSSWGIWDSIQVGLDVAGLVPIIGELADLTNAGISLARGDYEGAVLSLSAMVPIVGNAAGTAKIIRSAEKFTDSNIVTKGGTYKLRDADGIVQRTGKSNDLNRRRREHARHQDTKDLDFEVDRRTDNPLAQRGREQIIYDQNPQAQAKNGGLNKRRPISPTNKKRNKYMKAGEKL